MDNKQVWDRSLGSDFKLGATYFFIFYFIYLFFFFWINYGGRYWYVHIFLSRTVAKTSWNGINRLSR